MSLTTRLNMLRQRRQRNGGFTLLEVLITVFIASTGLLSLSALQIAGVHYSRSAYYRTQATLAIYDIVDRMRVNREGLEAGSYDAVDTSATTPSDPGCISTGCTPTELADYDIREWSRLFKNVDGAAGFVAVLPAAQGTVTRVAGTLFTVTISWQEQIQGDATSKQLSMNYRLLD